MIFVSYSHADDAWRKRFETVSKPLSRAESMVFWSDKNIRIGEWEKQIESAMKGAVAAVLLVSDNFVASDYIVDKEKGLCRVTSEFKIITKMVPASVAKRRNWKKFGQSANDGTGPQPNTTFVGDDVQIQVSSNRNSAKALFSLLSTLCSQLLD